MENTIIESKMFGAANLPDALRDATKFCETVRIEDVVVYHAIAWHVTVYYLEKNNDA